MIRRRDFLSAAVAAPMLVGAAREATAATSNEWTLDYNGVHLRVAWYSVAKFPRDKYDPTHPDDPYRLKEGYERFDRVLQCHGRADYTRIVRTKDEERLFTEAVAEYFAKVLEAAGRINDFAREFAPRHAGLLLIQSRLLTMGKPFTFHGDHSAVGARRQGVIMSHVALQEPASATPDGQLVFTNDINVGTEDHPMTICYQLERP